MAISIETAILRLQKLQRSLWHNREALKRSSIFCPEEVPMIKQTIDDQEHYFKELLTSEYDISLERLIYELSVVWNADERDIAIDYQIKIKSPRLNKDTALLNYNKALKITFSLKNAPDINFQLACRFDPNKRMLDGRKLSEHLKFDVHYTPSHNDILIHRPTIKPTINKTDKIIITATIGDFLFSPLVERNNEPKHIKLSRQALFSSAIYFQEKYPPQKRWWNDIPANQNS